MDAFRISLILIGATILVGIYLFDRNKNIRQFFNNFKHGTFNVRKKINNFFQLKNNDSLYNKNPINDETEIFQQIENMQAVVASPYGNSDKNVDKNSDANITESDYIVDQPVVAPGDELLIVFYIKAHSQAIFLGKDIKHAAETAGFILAKNKMFEARAAGNNSDKRILCSLANAFEPGTFVTDMTSFTSTALIVILCLPGPINGIEALEQTISICKKLAHELNADLCDDSRSVLTNQTISHLKEKIKDYFFHLTISQAHKS